MFSTGQVIFGVLFFIVFAIVIFFSYRKDIKIHRKYYKGSLYILIGLIIFIFLLFALKHFLKG